MPLHHFAHPDSLPNRLTKLVLKDRQLGVSVNLLLVALFVLVSSVAAEEPDVNNARTDTPVAMNGSAAQSFLKQFCIDCHSVDSAEGEREFESFTLPIDSHDGLITADEIIDQVTIKQMPPEDAPQPTAAQRVALADYLRGQMRDASDRFTSTGGRTVLRRLSNREYENTLAALFGRRVDTLGLTADFPKDSTSEHLDNIGASLVTSGLLLDQYFQAASRLVDSRLGKPEMAPKDWHFTEHFIQYEELSGAHSSFFKNKFLAIYEQPNTDTRQGGYAHIEDFLEGVPVSGLYDVEVLAQAMHRDTHYDPKIFRVDLSEPFQLAVVPGDATKGHIHYPQAIEPILGQTTVPDDQPEWLRFRVWLEEGQTPRFIFPNGPYESRASVIAVNKRYKDEFKKPRDGVVRTHILREGALPHIKIGEVKVRGPIEETEGTAEEIAVFGPGGFDSKRATEQLFDFARRAFRRPLTQADRDRLNDFYSRRMIEDATPRTAAFDTLKLILCSPSFLYFSEITPEDQTTLGDFDLASRLSYALWAAPPDEELFTVASSGQLTDPKVLKKQFDRMIADSRSSEFVDGFLDSWLNLRDLGNQPPPRTAAVPYYAEALPDAMKQEARLFFRHVMDNERPVTDFLNADYTFVNKNLAKLYQLPEAETMRLADGFQQVTLKPDARRGGVLGMAGVLTVSANGVETSPVTRGVWVSENLLGVTPPPPPDEVPAIDANVSGAKSIREKLKMHRADESCNTCHRNIDPLGFALETFDPIGRRRVNYPKVKGKSAKIDASGKFPSGETYRNFDEFKSVLIESRKELFTRTMIEKMLAYVTGRHMEIGDRFEIDEITAKVTADGDKLNTLISEVFASEICRSR